jgi:hypothetical protein
MQANKFFDKTFRDNIIVDSAPDLLRHIDFYIEILNKSNIFLDFKFLPFIEKLI